MRYTQAFIGTLVSLLIASPHAYAEMTDYPLVKLRSLDKVTARTMTFDARVGSTTKFGSIYIQPKSCKKPDLQERPEAASFLQIWEINDRQESKWVFSGWMFASSPSLSAMDHPVYDVWVIDCIDDPNKKQEIPPELGQDVSGTAAPPADDSTPGSPSTAKSFEDVLKKLEEGDEAPADQKEETQDTKEIPAAASDPN